MSRLPAYCHACAQRITIGMRDQKCPALCVECGEDVWVMPNELTRLLCHDKNDDDDDGAA